VRYVQFAVGHGLRKAGRLRNMVKLTWQVECFRQLPWPNLHEASEHDPDAHLWRTYTWSLDLYVVHWSFQPLFQLHIPSWSEDFSSLCIAFLFNKGSCLLGW